MKEEKKYYWTDAESGIEFECSKEYRENMLAMWEQARPKYLEGHVATGKLMVFGTGGDVNDSFIDMWNDEAKKCGDDPVYFYENHFGTKMPDGSYKAPPKLTDLNKQFLRRYPRTSDEMFKKDKS